MVAAGALGACAVLLFADPADDARYPTCPFLAVTGRWCPGCGSLRGLRALLRGDVAAAAGFNILLLVAVPYLLYSWAAWAAETRGRARPAPLRLPAGAVVAIGVGAVVFAVLRNLPMAPLTALAP